MVVVGPAAATGDSTPSPHGPAKAPGLTAVHARLRDAVGPRGYLGGVVLAIDDGRVVDVHADGHADLARKRPMRRDAIFRVYSMTKPLASVAVLQLVESGRIGLDEPVARYLPEFAGLRVLAGGDVDAPMLRAPARAPTIRHLLTHTAGFAAGRPGDAVADALLARADLHGARDLAGFASRLATVPLAADPGTRFGYDGAATEVLARVVEVVAGEPFDVRLRARVLAPLGMRDTGFSVPPSQRHRVVDITRMGDDGRLVLDEGVSARSPGVPLQHYPSAAGGLYSTAADYARFCRMLLEGGTLDGVRVLRRRTVAMMLENQLTMLDPPVHSFNAGEGFGFGGYVVRDAAHGGEPGAAGRFGWSGAASTMFAIDPATRRGVLLLLQHLPREDLPAGVHDLPRIAPAVRTTAFAAMAR